MKDLMPDKVTEILPNIQKQNGSWRTKGGFLLQTNVMRTK